MPEDDVGPGSSHEQRAVLGRGNRTQVTLVRRVGEQIVEKRLLPFADVSLERKALYREALIQQAARGPGVVPISDRRFSHITAINEAGENLDEVQAIERGYVNGASLKDLLKPEQRARLSRERCVGWMICLAMTLSRVHDLKGKRGGPLRLVHRDVTLGNVLVDDAAVAGPASDSGAMLNDFGLAHVGAWGPLCPEETLQGVPRFLSPELKAGFSPTAASDVYQTALLLCVLLSAKGSKPIASLFEGGFGSPANQEARQLLAPWHASAALDPEPLHRPSAAELAQLLRAAP